MPDNSAIQDLISSSHALILMFQALICTNRALIYTSEYDKQYL